MSRTKIMVTIGPGSNSAAMIRSLRQAGADLARLNGAHGDHDWHRSAIRTLRQTFPDMPILLDVPGRKIRTGTLSKPVFFLPGDRIVFTPEGRDYDGAKVPVTHPNLAGQIAPGTRMLVDDGRYQFTVVGIEGGDVICEAQAAGQITSKKGINIPSVSLKTNHNTQKDSSLMDFALEEGVDFVGISFVDSAEIVRSARSMMGDRGPRIVAKIENQFGLDNVETIADAADALMIDRGDLSAETALESMALSQKKILAVARVACKPVIVATEMLHSMIDNPVPTKAEVSDITNAVLDGASVVMLSGETAVGKFPIEAVGVMRRIVEAAEIQMQTDADSVVSLQSMTVPQAMGQAIALLCRRLPITKIVAITISGYAARAIAAIRPRQNILAVSNNPAAARSFNLLAGVRGLYLDIPFSRTSTDHIPRCLQALWRSDELSLVDVVLVVSVGYPRSGNRMNLIETHSIGDLHKALGWNR